MVTLEHKKNLAERFESYLQSHKSLMLLDTTNINTNLIVEVKNQLLAEGDCKFLHGKKASFAKRLRQMSEEQNNPKLLKLVDIMHGDVLLFFTNNSVSAAARKVEEYYRMGQAVYSRPSLLDYWIEPQLTRLANEMTRVFQKLRVPTKITKGNMEITAKFQVLTKGKIVSQLQLDVLNALNILPYRYQVRLVGVYTDGEIADPSIYSMPIDTVSQAVKNCLGNVQGLAHGTSFPTQNVCKATVTKSLNDLLALSCAISDKVEPSEIFAAKIKLASDPEALAKLQSAATAVAAPAAAGDAKKEANAPAAKEESSDDESVEELDMDF
jgi:large subunit ribosomal protein LP0